MTFQGDDDLQAVFRALWISDIYVRKICADNDIEVYSVVPGDITSDFDTYKA